MQNESFRYFYHYHINSSAKYSCVWNIQKVSLWKAGCGYEVFDDKHIQRFNLACNFIIDIRQDKSKFFIDYNMLYCCIYPYIYVGYKAD